MNRKIEALVDVLSLYLKYLYIKEMRFYLIEEKKFFFVGVLNIDRDYIAYIVRYLKDRPPEGRSFLKKKRLI